MKYKKCNILIPLMFLLIGCSNSPQSSPDSSNSGTNGDQQQDFVYDLVLNSTNKPIINSSTQSGTLAIYGEDIVYSKAITEETAHVKLLDGGTISKGDTKGLESITASFSGGSLKVLTGYDNKIFEFEYSLVNNVPLVIKGNFIKILAIGDVVINSLTILCDGENSATADSVGLRKIQIVYNKDNSNAGCSIAKELQQAFKVKYGVYLQVRENNQPATINAINLGFNNSAEEGKYSVVVNKSSMNLVANDKYGEYEAARFVLNNIERNDVFGSFETTTNSYDVNNNDFKIMSYNVRVGNDGKLADGSWGNIVDRSPRIVKNILDKCPDTVGVQEASDAWTASLKSALAPTYLYVGLGRESSRTGESTGIFYNVNKVKLVESDTKWFSDTPDVPGSHIPNYGGYNRIYTYAIFQRISDGKFFMHVNSHYDLNVDARLKDGEYQKAFTDLHIDEMPVFSTADFNSDKKDDNDVIRWFMNNGYTSCVEDIKDPIDINTYPVEGYSGVNVTGGGTIDYIFKCNNGVLFDDYEVLNYKVQAGKDTAPAPTSDHYPIYAAGHFVEPLIPYTNPYTLPSKDIAINNCYETFDGNMNFVSSISEYKNRASVKANNTDSVEHNGTSATDPYRNIAYIDGLSGTNKFTNYSFKSNKETVGDLVLVIAGSNPSNGANNDMDLSALMNCSINDSPISLDNIVLKCHDVKNFVEWTQLVIKNVNIVEGVNTVKLSGSVPNQYSLDIFADSEVSPLAGHIYSEQWESSLAGHFHRCIDEGFENLTTPIEKHTFDETTGLCSVCNAKAFGELDLTANAVTLEQYNNKINYVVNMKPNYSFNVINLEKLVVEGDNNQGTFQCVHAEEGQENYVKFYFDISSAYPTEISDSIYIAPHLMYDGLPFDGISGDIRNHYKDTNWDTRFYNSSQYDASPNHNKVPMYMIEPGHDLTVGKVRARIIYKWSMFMISMSWTEGTVDPTIKSTTNKASFFDMYVYNCVGISSWNRHSNVSCAPLLYISFEYTGIIRPETLTLDSPLTLAGFCNGDGVVSLVFDCSQLEVSTPQTVHYYYMHLFKNGSPYNYAGVAAGDVKTSGSKSTGGTKKTFCTGKSGSILAAATNGNYYELYESYSMLLIGAKNNG